MKVRPGERYIWYLCLPTADGHPVTLFACTRCGATVGERDEGTNVREVHDEWHDRLTREPGP